MRCQILVLPLSRPIRKAKAETRVAHDRLVTRKSGQKVVFFSFGTNNNYEIDFIISILEQLQKQKICFLKLVTNFVLLTRSLRFRVYFSPTLSCQFMLIIA